LKQRAVVILVLLVGIGGASVYWALRGTPVTRSEPGQHRPVPNTIMLVLDTVRADRLGCYGSELGITPNIDRWARHAVRFDRAFSHAPWTLPSVASLLTSRYPVQHGAGGHVPDFRVLAQQAVTLAEVFQRAGTATHAIVNVLFLTETAGMTQGFDTVDADAPETNLEVRRAGPTTDAALSWIDRHRERPFFLLVHYFDAHLIYDPPAPYRERFADVRDRLTTDHLFGTRGDMMGLRTGGARLDRTLVARLERLYNGEVAYLDAEIGRLLAGVSERGLDDNTVVVLTADHGEEFLEHDGFEHGHTHHDELLHVPLLIRAPGIGAPASVSATVRQVDVAPTLCELTGVEPDRAFVGQSLVPLLEGRGGTDRPVLSQGNFWGQPSDAWRQGGMKLIRSFETGDIQLFDLRSDPGERIDLADRAPQQRERMLNELKLVLLAIETDAVTGENAVLTQQEIDHLTSLGYLVNDDASDKPPETPGD
jgi:arylsulfatase A-like enzyme